MSTHRRLLLVAALILGLVLIIYVNGPAVPDQQPIPQEPPMAAATSPTPAATSPKKQAPSTPPTTTVTTKTNAMTVATHQQPGKVLVVESVSLVNPGFIIVQDASGDRDQVSPTKIIATSPLLKAGVTKNVLISVTTSPGARYFLTLRTDNSNKTFIPQEDPIALDIESKPISILITTDSPSATGLQTYYVNIANLAFTPKALTVKRGDMVLFRNVDIFGHTVTATAFGGRNVVAAGGSYLLDTANLAPGTYSYLCEYHSPMTGSITIQ